MTSENHSNAQQPAPSADEVTDAGIVKEYTTPLKHEIDPDINLFDFLEGRAQRNPDGSMVSYKDANGIWQTFSATEFRDKVVAIARGLIGWGARAGESIAIIAHTVGNGSALDNGHHVHRLCHRAGV